MSQTWRRLTFLHWPYEPRVIRPLIPSGLDLDTFGGAAWVGLIPFEIHNLRGIPHFPETNVRTYVVGPDGSRAVWFFSLDADRLAAVIGARVGYSLPYFWANMQVIAEDGRIRYRSRRRWPHAADRTTDITVRPGERLEAPGERDHFFTARYRLYAARQGRLACADIDHPPWPLARAEALEVRQNLIEAAGLPSPEGAPLALYCESIQVKIGYLDTLA